MIALILGTALAVGALAFVLYPIFFGVPARPPVREPGAEGASVTADLRELEFDRATGKLSDADYAELETRSKKDAIMATRRQARAPLSGAESAATMDDEIEAAVLAYREKRTVCATCGPRPEPDAVFCSNCGRYLSDRCAACGTPVVARDARYCLNCGNRFAN
jgi:hypothetical protein